MAAPLLGQVGEGAADVGPAGCRRDFRDAPRHRFMLMAQRVTWLWCLCLSDKPLHRLRAWGSDAVPHCACDLQGQPLAVQECAALWSRCAPVATAVCAGFADHRAELRLSPEVRSSRMTIGTLRKAGTGVRRFPSRVSKVGVYELLLSRRHNARRRGDKVHTLLRPRRKAQEVVEEPRRQVVVLRREVQTI